MSSARPARAVVTRSALRISSSARSTSAEHRMRSPGSVRGAIAAHWAAGPRGAAAWYRSLVRVRGLVAFSLVAFLGCDGLRSTFPDGGSVDSGTPDAGTPDAGTPDAGACGGTPCTPELLVAERLDPFDIAVN